MGAGRAERLVGTRAGAARFDLDPGKARVGRLEAVAARVVILSLPSEDAVRAALTSLLPALRPGAVIHATFTVRPIAARGFAERAAAAAAST
jgi:3-hydroxyisobutyrate dehydrogenase-like beta-hydroxyacid dehydrogenase